MVIIPRLRFAKLRRPPIVKSPAAQSLVPHNRGITIPIPALGTVFSLEAWFLSTSSLPQRLLETNEFSLTVTAGILTLISGGVTMTGASGIADSAWHHVVVTYDATNFRVYVDGVLVAGPSAASVNFTATQMYVGTDWLGTTNLSGRMADLAVYPTALNASQIANHYGLRTSTSVLTSVMTVRDRQFDAKSGTVTGGVTFLQTGPLGDAATTAAFDGLTGYVDAGDQSSFDFDRAFSLEAWFKTTATGLRPIVTKTIAAGNGWGLFVTGGAIRFWAYTSGGVSIFDVSVGSGYNDGAFHHVAATWDFTTTSGHVKIYVDGVLVGTGTAASTAQQGSAGHTLRLGYRADNAGNFFSGTLADVALYWYALTAAQVTAHYAARLLTLSYSAAVTTYRSTVIADSAVGYWRMNAATGTTEVDQSGAGSNAAYASLFTLGQPGAIDDGDPSVLFTSNGNGVLDTGGYATVSVSALGTTWSIEAWLKRSGAPAGSLREPFSIDGLETFVNTSATTLSVYQVSSGLTRVVGAVNICDGEWHHIVITCNGSSTKLYVDGVQDGATYAGAINIVGTTLHIARWFGGGYTWGGFVDEVALYATAFNPSQVLVHYNAAFAAHVETRTGVARVGFSQVG